MSVKAKKRSRSGSKNSRSQGRPQSDKDAVGQKKIIAATRTLLRDVSPSKVTRLDVAKAADVDPALIRYYFGDLQHLLREVLQEMAEELKENMQALIQSSESPRTKLTKRIQAFVEFGANNPAFYQLFVEQVIHSDTDWSKQYRESITAFGYGQISQIVADGRKTGEFHKDFDDRFLYILIVGATEFFFLTGRPIFSQLFPDTDNPENLSDAFSEFLTDIVLRGIEKG